jgi:hypothetical protein
MRTGSKAELLRPASTLKTRRWGAIVFQGCGPVKRAENQVMLSATYSEHDLRAMNRGLMWSRNRMKTYAGIVYCDTLHRTDTLTKAWQRAARVGISGQRLHTGQIDGWGKLSHEFYPEETKALRSRSLAIIPVPLEISAVSLNLLFIS